MLTEHPLDRPGWSALTGRHARFAIGHGDARRYDPVYGVFAGVGHRSEAGSADLATLVADHGDVVILEPEAPPMTPALIVLSQDVGVQMIATRLEAAPAPGFDMVKLGEDDAVAMLALATLTVPGPFFSRTHQLGDFFGVKIDGQLVAMAGERMKPVGFTEVSGVCTHPDHRGCGYAGALMRLVAARIIERGETPFLHAYASNEGAIALYRRLGFVLRREVLMTWLGRAAGR